MTLTWPQQDFISDLFSKILFSKGKVYSSETKEQVYRAVWMYMFFASHADFFTEILVEEGSKSAKSLRSDYGKIEKLSNQLIKLLELTKAGSSISGFEQVKMLPD